ncbi:MAG: BBP7 family outer membrane beta-barrel protein [Gemmataceae bacterium]
MNPWTFQPWDAAFGQIHQQPMGDWLVPAPEMFRPRERLEVRAEYLLWWTRGSNYPPLVTTDSPNAPQVTQGALPPTGTATVLFGGPQDPRLQSGARFGFTYWLGDCGLWGLDANYFFLGSRSDRFAASSDQFPVLGRPFINAITGQENRQLTATPGTNPGDVFALRGAVSVDAPSRLSGWDIGLRRCLCSDCCWKVDVTFGYRELDLFDGVDIHEDIVSLKAVPGAGGLLDPGNRIQVLDSFTTHNHFHGAQAGLRGEYRWNDFIFEGKFNLALGYTDQSVNILGGQTITRLTGQQQTFVGGLLALPSNIGYFSQQRFGVVPEVGVKIGYQLTDNLRVYAGYDFLFWNSVVRASDQIDRRLNPFLVPGLIIPPQPVQGPILPRVPMSTTTYWAQGVSFGLEWRY